MLKSKARHFAWLPAIATLTAIARLIVVHRAILARLRATRLVCCETHCANRGCQNRKQDFEIILHRAISLSTIAKASEKKELRRALFATATDCRYRCNR